MLEIPSPPPLAAGRLRLLEPAGCAPHELLQQLIDGSYLKPFIEDCGPLRYLHFDLDNVQSVMRLDDPYALCLAYTRKMMAFLLFNSAPRRILQLGLGGGSLAKFCYKHLPDATLTVVEIDRDVLALRDEFQVPADDERFRVVEGNGAEYISQAGPRDDVVIVDACDRDGLSPTLLASELYSNLRRRLTLNGVLVVNICGDEDEVESHMARMRGVFGQQRLVTLPAREDGNLIVLGFRREPQVWDGVELDAHSRRLQERFGLAFPRFARQMQYGLRGQ
ncbi:MAG: spermidine synthase-like protein [Proteobacteria bacterium]|nr:spermidine synthase-like protein [Pseudomonadota bacterium]